MLFGYPLCHGHIAFITNIFIAEKLKIADRVHLIERVPNADEWGNIIAEKLKIGAMGWNGREPGGLH